jgi:hypothetical protein
VSEPLRKAALVLSSLHEADRRWLLAQLDGTQRDKVTGLVQELAGMNLALDDETLKRLLRPLPAAAVEEAAESALGRASARAVFDVLAAQPDRIVALVLAARSWPWREGFLRLLGTERRLRVQRARPPRGELRPQAVAALLVAVESRLDEEATDAHAMAASTAAAAWQRPVRFLKGLTTWRR